MSSASFSIEGSSSWKYYPLITLKAEKKKPKDWVKIGSIVAIIVGGLLAALAVLCIMKFLPSNLLGGPIGIGVTLIVGAAILLPAAYVLFNHLFCAPRKKS